MERLARAEVFDFLRLHRALPEVKRRELMFLRSFACKSQLERWLSIGRRAGVWLDTVERRIEQRRAIHFAVVAQVTVGQSLSVALDRHERL